MYVIRNRKRIIFPNASIEFIKETMHLLHMEDAIIGESVVGIDLSLDNPHSTLTNLSRLHKFIRIFPRKILVIVENLLMENILHSRLNELSNLDGKYALTHVDSEISSEIVEMMYDSYPIRIWFGRNSQFILPNSRNYNFTLT